MSSGNQLEKLQYRKLQLELYQQWGILVIAIVILGLLLWSFASGTIRVEKITIGNDWARADFVTDTPAEEPLTGEFYLAHYGLEIASSSAAAQTFWVYIGETYDGSDVLQTRLFSLDKPPAVGESISAITAVSKRTTKPIQTEDSEWRLGLVQGVLSAGSVVEVVETVVIPGVNNRQFWWSKVQLL